MKQMPGLGGHSRAGSAASGPSASPEAAGALAHPPPTGASGPGPRPSDSTLRRAALRPGPPAPWAVVAPLRLLRWEARTTASIQVRRGTDQRHGAVCEVCLQQCHWCPKTWEGGVGGREGEGGKGGGGRTRANHTQSSTARVTSGSLSPSTPLGRCLRECYHGMPRRPHPLPHPLHATPSK